MRTNDIIDKCITKITFFQFTLGGLRDLEKRKNEVRIKHNLPPLTEDMYSVCENMRPASPPASAADLIEHQVPRRGIRAGKRVSTWSKTSLPKIKGICHWRSLQPRWLRVS